MTNIRQAKLELLRQGPQHNQLLSPLTPYFALCGRGAPQTVHVPFEHHQLLMRLARLRYEQGGCAIPREQRESELRELGEAMGRMLGEVGGLQTVLDEAARDSTQTVHLRLAMSALELGMVPFEVLIAPDRFPGSGAPLLLRTRTVITREVRRSEPIDVQWNRPPRILFAFFSPTGQPAVPAQEHLDALRRAIDPYVTIDPCVASDPAAMERRLQSVGRYLEVLPDASVKDIADACRRSEFTHVHLLAHGAPFEEAGNQRFGIVLRPLSGDGFDVVSGERLALALCGGAAGAGTGKVPTLVSLATCDSGTIETVLVPGGSIAHALHDAGVPWVVASQFPLWMSASTIAVEALYGPLLAGADPRLALHELRQRLRTEEPDTHDWASIVAYAVTPWDFDEQIQAFHDRQLRKRLDVRFARIDELAAASGTDETEFDALAAAIREEHQSWIARTKERSATHPKEHAHALGMFGASEKRIAIALQKRKGQVARRQARAAYTASRDAYLDAIRADPANHWVITQFLSIVATPLLMPDKACADVRSQFAAWWTAARQIAEWQLRSTQGQERAWTLATQIELTLLASVFDAGGPIARAARTDIVKGCQDILDCVPRGDFTIQSTARQLRRYQQDWHHKRWSALAKAGIDVLEPPEADPDS